MRSQAGVLQASFARPTQSSSAGMFKISVACVGTDMVDILTPLRKMRGNTSILPSILSYILSCPVNDLTPVLKQTVVGRQLHGRRFSRNHVS